VKRRHRILLDTGPLVALLNRRDQHHRWARDQFAEIEPPLLTCEPVLTEASYLLRGCPGGSASILDFLRRGVLEVPFVLAREVDPVQQLQHRYADLPMSLADACLVRMAELHAGATVLTIDSDFTVYRMHGRRVIPTLSPGAPA
jgi:predicted nucleic acid-binding protein